MTPDRFAQLTDRQRECLRLVTRGFESKEIARQLGISFYAVDTRLARATQTLGARGRREAARMLEAHEASISERIAYGLPHDALKSQPDILSPGHDRTVEGPAPLEGEVSLLQSTPSATRGFHWPIPTEGRRTNDLSLPAILFWVGTGAVAIGLIILGLIAVALTAHDQVSRISEFTIL